MRINNKCMPKQKQKEKYKIKKKNREKKTEEKNIVFSTEQHIEPNY